MAHKGTIVVNGIVLDALPNTMFTVKLEDDREILTVLAGKLRLHHITVMPGDRVQVEMTPYDDKKGRIIYRGR